MYMYKYTKKKPWYFLIDISMITNFQLTVQFFLNLNYNNWFSIFWITPVSCVYKMMSHISQVEYCVFVSKVMQSPLVSGLTVRLMYWLLPVLFLPCPLFRPVLWWFWLRRGSQAPNTCSLWVVSTPLCTGQPTSYGTW